MRKFIIAFILIPLAVIIVMFAVANREIITVAFDPFNSANPAYAVRMPLFILIFVLVGLGVLIGGSAAWLKQHKWRVRARRAEADVRRLRTELDAERSLARAPPPRETPPLIVPPAA
jgi:heme/copper-type cytochrome/quinol oxidase subunit 1